MSGSVALKKGRDTSTMILPESSVTQWDVVTCTILSISSSTKGASWKKLQLELPDDEELDSQLNAGIELWIGLLNNKVYVGSSGRLGILYVSDVEVVQGKTRFYVEAKIRTGY
jgi:hypothetical protein